MWFFRTPDVVFGPDSLQFLSTLNIKRAVIVTDSNISKAGLVDLVTRNLEGTEILVVDSIPQEPSIDEIAGNLKTVAEFKPDWVIGVGGGSSMDAAKLLFFKCARPDLDYFDITPLEPLGLKKKLGLIAIPTTSGTGSECTWAAVITDSADRRKAELASPEIIPDYAILDPAMVMDLPEKITGNTAADALTHAIEAYVSTWSNPYSDAFAQKAISLITEGIQKVLSNPHDVEGRDMVHTGASMAGSAFSNSQIGLAHAMGHAFGAIFEKPHGACVGIFLPGVVRFNSKTSGGRYAALNESFHENIRGKTLEESVMNFLTLIRAPLKISDLGIQVEEFNRSYDRIVDLSFESTGIIANPREVEKDDILDILDGIK